MHHLSGELARGGHPPDRPIRHHGFEVVVELENRAGKSLAWDPEQLSQQLELLVERLAFVRLQAFHKRLIRHERRIGQCRVHPEQ